MDIPLDFSMNSCKEDKDDKNSGNETKRSGPIRYVLSKEQGTLNLNVYHSDKKKTERMTMTTMIMKIFSNK